MRVFVKKALILCVSVTFVLSIFTLANYVGGLKNSNNSVNTNANAEDSANVKKPVGKVNLLIIGVDNEGLRSDTIIVASYDLDKNVVNMLSIPRDTRMYIGNRYQKINSAHALTNKDGKTIGVSSSIEAVNRLTGIPIDYYIEFGFSTFKDTVNALGGMDFDVPRNMYYVDPVQDLKIDLKKGYQHLNGEKAEQLVRFRSYPEGDIARVNMQQKFIKALAQQKLNAGIVKKLPDLFSVINKNIKTDITVLDILKYTPAIAELSPENVVMQPAR